MRHKFTLTISHERETQCKEYPQSDKLSKTLDVSSNSTPYSSIHAAALIESVVEFIGLTGIDPLETLCHAIEMLGQAGENDTARIYMGPLYDPACKATRTNGEKE